MIISLKALPLLEWHSEYLFLKAFFIQSVTYVTGTLYKAESFHQQKGIKRTYSNDFLSNSKQFCYFLPHFFRSKSKIYHDSTKMTESMEHEQLQRTGSSNDSYSLEPHEKVSGESFNEYHSEVLDEAPGLPKKPITEYAGTILIFFCIAFGEFIYGWDTGTISGFVAFDNFLENFGEKRKDDTYYLSNVRTGLIVAIFNIGCAVGGIFLSKIGDIYGRKIGIIFMNVIYIIGQLICITSMKHKWYQYTIGRIISGLAVGGFMTLIPIFLAETAPKHLRGLAISVGMFMCTLGILLGYCANLGLKDYTTTAQWRIPLGLTFAWAILLFAGVLVTPESPRYLCECKKIELAKKSVARSNKVHSDDPAVQSEIDAMLASIQYEKEVGTASWAELFSTKDKILQRLIIGIFIQAFQQLTGDNYFFYYATTIFKSVGMSNSYITSIILGAINFGSSFISMWSVDHIGRRRSLLWGAALMAICMVIYASLGVTRLYPHGRSQPPSKAAGDVMIVFTCLYILFFATTWEPCAWLIVSEIYPLRIRSKGMSLASSANWIFGFLISFFTPFINSAIHFSYGYVFMGCLVAMFLFVFFFVPETTGLSLEEIGEMFEEGVLAWKSRDWVPSAKREAGFTYTTSNNSKF
ncbi:hypothetical protein KAFR_0G00160 [Kazachstania africana CBS 2517]|uniref:Major facilitator superfamily (MFS) profile domain-containing protein n=1 Tax=Kazachstania africana (strain ATCC 22294 / BCRC 22015 / CBS 2517 / CECT 1963 / NBRC 1671 / NRRL Y-8276) TaxID=1071382 RepID=H2AXE9_KAZAF|nr:hypothetical protein KAFR_0G00160 [Kazachstania africana CBS 2517]CCF59049.1 hypothetical protein KAFR_0G00160 [Kazachstania africana CBS 2517]